MSDLAINFEHDFQKKVMTQVFENQVEISSIKQITLWRNEWMKELKSWHSPYKALIDFRKVSLQPSSEVQDAIKRMFKFFEGFFLKKAVVLLTSDQLNHKELFPCESTADEDEAYKLIGLKRDPSQIDKSKLDFRAQIQVSNHFNQHVVELAFADKVQMGKAELTILKSKLTNNLMQWHSSWSLLVDCSHLEISPEAKEGWPDVEKFFKSFFLKKVVGYSPAGPKESYPFEVFRARHNAAARLEAEGLFSGDAAHCKSEKST